MRRFRTPISLPAFCAALALVVTPATVAFAGLPAAPPDYARAAGAVPKSELLDTVADDVSGKVERATGTLPDLPGFGLNPGKGPAVPDVPPAPAVPVVPLPSQSAPGQSKKNAAPDAPAPSGTTSPAESPAAAAPAGLGGSSVSGGRTRTRSQPKRDLAAPASAGASRATAEIPAGDSGGPVADLVKSTRVTASKQAEEPSSITRIIELVPQRYRIAIAVLAVLCLLLAVVLIRERVRSRRAEIDAMTDPLTGLMNRRAFDRTLADEWARAQRYGRPLSLLFLDVDQFKQFNDSKGHLAGDDLLREMATRLRNQLRSLDVAARLGGDEFVIICPETDEDGVRQAAARLNRVLTELPVRVSIGQASRRDDDGALSDLMTRADRQMYKAKALASVS